MGERNWLIVYQQRDGFNETIFRRLVRKGADPADARRNWRCYRKYSVLPLRFATAAAAQQYLDWLSERGLTFKNMTGRKLSCSVTSRSQLRRALGL